MPIKIQTTNDVKVDGVKSIIYGPPGVGKTRLSTTIPNCIIIASEGGLLSLAHDNIPYISATTVNEINESYMYVRSKSCEYDTIFIDSLSNMSEILLDDFKKDVADKRQAYGKLADAIHPMIWKFRHLKGKNVVFICKQTRREDEYTGRTTIEPFMPGRVLPEAIPYIVDELLYMDIDRKGRFLTCQPKIGLPIKDRSGQLAAREEPNLQAIFDKILRVNIEDASKIVTPIKPMKPRK